MSFQEIKSIDEIPSNKRVCLYGAGKFGEELYKEIGRCRPDIQVAFLVDSYKSGKKWGLDMVTPQALIQEKKSKYDLVLITSSFSDQILELLDELGIEKKMVVSKHFWHYNMLANFIERQHYAFTSMAIELSTNCNMSCTFCAYSVVDREKRDMDYGLFTRIIDEISEQHVTENIIFVGLGEPLLYPRLEDAIAYCAERKLSTKVITNGLVLNRNRYKELVDAGLDHLHISQHNMSQETFDYRRPNEKNFQSYFEAILDCIDWHAAHEPESKLIVGLMYDSEGSINSDFFNIPALKSETKNALFYFRMFLKKMKNIAVKHNVPCYLTEKAFLDALPKVSPKNAVEQIPVMPGVFVQLTHLMLPDPSTLHLFDRGNKFDIGQYQSDIIEKLENDHDNPLCEQVTSPIILSDGSFLPCCYATSVSELLMGRVDGGHSFSSILAGEKYRTLFQGFRDHRLVIPYCRKCRSVTYYTCL